MSRPLKLLEAPTGYTHYIRDDNFDANYEGIKIGQGEQVCLNRCIGKLMNVKELVDNKIKDHVEMPPILYNQNLP